MADFPFQQFAREAFEARFPSVAVTQAEGLAPFQATGTLNGWPFYLRSRGGVTTLKIYSRESGVLVSHALYSSTVGIELNSLARPWDFDLFEKLVKTLDVAPFPYRFWAQSYTVELAPGTTIEDESPCLIITLDPDNTSIQTAWGSSATEAREAIRHAKWLQEHYTVSEEQLALLAGRYVTVHPEEEDERSIPPLSQVLGAAEG